MKYIIVICIFLTMIGCHPMQLKQPVEKKEVKSISFIQLGNKTYEFNIRADSFKKKYDFFWSENISINIEKNLESYYYHYGTKRYRFLNMDSIAPSDDFIYYNNSQKNIDSFNIKLIAVHDVPKYEREITRLYFLKDQNDNSALRNYGILLAIDNELNIKAFGLGFLSANCKEFLYSYVEGDIQLILNMIYLKCYRYTGIEF